MAVRGQRQSTTHVSVSHSPAMCSYLVEFQHSKLDLLVLVLLLLRLGVCLLLALLGSSKQAHKDVHGGLVRDTRRGQSSVIFQLTSAEHNPLLIAWDACAILDTVRDQEQYARCKTLEAESCRTLSGRNHGLHILDCVISRDIDRMGLVCSGTQAVRSI